MNGDNLFRHFIAAFIVITSLIAVALVAMVVFALWMAGLKVFLLVTLNLYIFGWLVHKIAKRIDLDKF